MRRTGALDPRHDAVAGQLLGSMSSQPESWGTAMLMGCWILTVLRSPQVQSSGSGPISVEKYSMVLSTAASRTSFQLA